MELVVLMVSTVGIGFIAVWKQAFHSPILKRKYVAALRRTDRVDAMLWGKKYYASKRPDGIITQSDLDQIQKDFDTMSVKKSAS